MPAQESAVWGDLPSLTHRPPSQATLTATSMIQDLWNLHQFVPAELGGPSTAKQMLETASTGSVGLQPHCPSLLVPLDPSCKPNFNQIGALLGVLSPQHPHRWGRYSLVSEVSLSYSEVKRNWKEESSSKHGYSKTGKRQTAPVNETVARQAVFLSGASRPFHPSPLLPHSSEARAF